MAGRKGGFAGACLLLIVVAGMERFTFKGVASNMVTYLTEVVQMSNSAAAKTVNNWCGFNSLVPIVVAPVADSYLNRYTTILGSSFIYILGLLALTSRAVGWPWRRAATNNKGIGSSLLNWSLPLISLGLGGFNASLQAFGVDQLGEDEDDDLPRTNDDVAGQSSDDRKSSFFNWWYFGICCGSLLGVSVMSYVQDTISWGLGFAVPTAVMLAAIALFICGTGFYTVKNAREISIATAIKNTVASTFKNCGLHKEKPDVVELQLQDHENPLCHSDGTENQQEKGNNILKIARVILRLLPVWTMLLMFAVIFQQPTTFFTRQGMTMKRNIGSKFMVPPAALQSAITISIILLMPLYDKLFIPFIRAFTRNERGVTVTQRMGIGMFLSVVTMAIAALTENKRLQIAGRQPRTPEPETVAMSIFWLLPQYILLGVSDVFTVVGMQEFFYAGVPADMKTLGIALYTSVFGVGNFLGSSIISLIEHFTSSTGKPHGWFSDDMREARLDKYYWLLALSSSVSLVAFIIFCKFLRVIR